MPKSIKFINRKVPSEAAAPTKPLDKWHIEWEEIQRAVESRCRDTETREARTPPDQKLSIGFRCDVKAESIADRFELSGSPSICVANHDKAGVDFEER